MKLQLACLISSLTVLFASGCPGSDDGGATPTSTATTTTVGSTADETGADTDSDSTTGGPNPSGTSNATTSTLPDGDGCCEAHAGGGCNESAVQTCVCDQDAACCTFDWTQSCVDIAQSRCDATCEADMTTGVSATNPTGDTDSGSASDTDSDSDSDSTTDDTFGTSGSFGGTFGTGGDVPLCCYGGGQGACGHGPTAECVCEINSECCDGEWTAQCAQIAAESCGACGSGDCCAPQTDATCNDAKVLECVCDLDGYCCETEYDDICANIAAADCQACNG